MDKVCEARRRMTVSSDDNKVDSSSGANSVSDKVMCTDQGQFYQTRDENEGCDEIVAKKNTWTRTKKIRQKTPEPKPCPPSLQNVKRNGIYKILHPHTEY